MTCLAPHTPVAYGWNAWDCNGGHIILQHDEVVLPRWLMWLCFPVKCWWRGSSRSSVPGQNSAGQSCFFLLALSAALALIKHTVKVFKASTSASECLILELFFCYWPEREVQVSLSILLPTDAEKACRARDEGCMNLSDMARDMT